jgi:galactonate dehydratase
MRRRNLCQSIALGLMATPILNAGLIQQAQGALSDMKITRIRLYNPSDTTGLSGWINQSAILVTIETDSGLVGVGQGGSKDLIEDIGGMLIGEDPFRIEYLWSKMYRNKFYPPGREKIHAIGALDCALWDLKAKALDVPLYELLGGLTRNHVECYQSYGTLNVDNARDNARRIMDAGYRAVRFHGVDYDENLVFDARKAVDQTARVCEQMRLGVGDDGDWILDAHTRFDLADITRLIKLIEPLNPFFVEDPLRNITDTVQFERLRNQVSVPLAAGEQFGDIMDGIRPLVEAGLIDYLRCSMPNTGGITPFRKIAGLCEAHNIGVVPHFTAPLATAAVSHAIFSISGPVLNEISRQPVGDYVNESYDLRDGKLWPTDLPGIGASFHEDRVNLIGEIDSARDDGLYQGEPYIRPDGSYLYL